MSHRAAKRERGTAAAPTVRRQAERGDARRCHPRRQFRPEGRLVNCCLPRVLRTVDDFYSPARQRVIDTMTTKAPPERASMLPDKSWRTTMSYGVTAKLAGVCVKTVRNAIRQALDLGHFTIESRNMDGGRYKATTYIARPYKPFLAAIRQNPTYFHTAEGHVIGIGRNPRILKPEDAQVWKIKPHVPPAPRSAGPKGTRRTEPQRKATTEEIEHVIDGLRRAGTAPPPDRSDAAKAIQASFTAARQYGVEDQMDAMLIEGLVLQIGRDYRPSPPFPKPTAGWFIKKLPEYIRAWARPTEPRSRTG